MGPPSLESASPLNELPRWRQPAGQWKKGDLVRFCYFHSLRQTWSIVAGVVAFCLLGLASVLSTGDPDRVRNPGFIYLFMLAMIGVCLCVPYVSAHAQYRKLAYAKEPMRFYFADDRVHLVAPSFSSAIEWRLVVRIYETRSSFLIYHAASIAWILPKHFFWGEEASIQRWREFVRQRLPTPDRLRTPGWLASRL